MAPHSSTLAWKIPWTEGPGRLQSMESQSRTQLSDFAFTFHFQRTGVGVGGREALEGRDICIHTADSPCCTAETNATDQISRSVMSDSLRPHEQQHARPPCPSPTP